MSEPFVLPLRDDPEARLQLVRRTLQIDAEVWRSSVADYGRTPGLASARVEQRLATFARAYAGRCPHRAAVPGGVDPSVCCACGVGSLRPVLARDPGSLVYGRCGRCGHGSLLRRGQSDDAPSPYAGAGYYARRDGRGVGYDDYAREAAYRERKGAQLVARIARQLAAAPASLLEVGSGFGYTRIAAERAGIPTRGVERNPHACDEANLRYGLASFCGELAQALASPESGIAVEAGAFVLRKAYLHLNLTLPADDIDAYDAAIRQGLAQGGWSREPAVDQAEPFRRGDLVAVLRHSRVHAEDLARGNAMPSHYRNLDVVVRTADYALAPGWERRPWDVFFEVGLREKLTRGSPQLIDAAEIAQHLPA